MVDPFAGLAPISSLFSTSNVSINLGASTNDTNQRVGQTSDLDKALLGLARIPEVRDKALPGFNCYT
eukprot:4036581-Amphidinium_carterae.1